MHYIKSEQRLEGGKEEKKSMLGANSMRKNAEIIQIKCEGTRYSKTEHMKKTCKNIIIGYNNVS